MSCEIHKIINSLIEKGIPFAIYSLPSSKNYVLIAQKNHKLKEISIDDINKINGFVIASFNSAKTNSINYIKPDFIIEEGESFVSLQIFLDRQKSIKSNKQKNNYELNKVEYLEKAEYLINKIKSGALSKIVLSRMLAHKLNKSFQIGELFDNLRVKYPDAFVYLLSSSETSSWIGASPETLIKIEANKIETMAVAGTQILDNYMLNKRWGEKEIEEQRLVSDYIVNLLSGIGVKNYSVTGPETIRAGKLVHLRTNFSINTESFNDGIGKFIKGLHPTPAVCGLPKADAFHLIEKAETHDRHLYTGFIGPWVTKDKSHLFVNLRCAEINDDKFNVYIGGGLTSDSVAEDEWTETENKSRTLLSVVENL